MKHIIRIRYNILMFLIFSVLTITGCSFVSHYDSMSYKQLTDLKGDMKVFFESCQSDGGSGDSTLLRLNDFKKASARAYEYEKGKQLNDDTAAQLEIIDDTVSKVIKRYKLNVIDGATCKERQDKKLVVETGCLTSGYCEGKWKALDKMFDIAISTENSKIKDKQK